MANVRDERENRADDKELNMRDLLIKNVHLLFYDTYRYTYSDFFEISRFTVSCFPYVGFAHAYSLNRAAFILNKVMSFNSTFVSILDIIANYT